VKTLGPGDSFGELSLMNNRPRLATIVSMGTTHCAILRKQEFGRIL
jgi:CRP-like cAMP-binding protein